MNEVANPIPVADKFKKPVLFLIILNTVLAAVIAYLQTDAAINSSKANAESQYYSILASGELLRQSMQSTYDMATYAEVIKNTQESLVFQFTSLGEATAGNLSGAEIASLQASIQEARAVQARIFSIFLTDPRYASKSEEQPPDFQSYLDDQTILVNDIVSKQNAASDSYHVWSKKSDGYVADLTILAVTFFLLGISQSSTSRVRYLFASLGLIMMVLSSVWGVLIFFS